MPTWIASYNFTLIDYLDSRGFGDGVDGFGRDIAYAFRSQAVEIINKAFQTSGMLWSAEEVDYVGTHNNCRIRVRGPSGTDRSEYIVCLHDAGWQTSGNPDIEKIRSTWQTAEALFLEAFDPKAWQAQIDILSDTLTRAYQKSPAELSRLVREIGEAIKQIPNIPEDAQMSADEMLSK